LIKKKEGTSEKFTIESFNEAIDKKFEKDPEEIHAPFVIGRKIEGQRFVIVWTTKKLQNLIANQQQVQIDATYKIVYMGYPIFVSIL
jgi:hypothetical protein